VSDRGQKTEDREQRTETPLLVALFPRACVFIAVALLTMPLFAHGCHGDDVDHEPLLIPTRFNPDDS
jgi:hypothetical protein